MDNLTSYNTVNWGIYFLNSYTTINSLIFIIGTLGNLLVIYVVGRFSSMQTVTNIHLMSLAVADTLYLLSIPIMLSAFNSKAGFRFGWVLCKAFWFFSTVNWFAGTFSLTAVSADRYMAILHPFVAQPFRTPRNTIIVVIALWIFAIGLMIPAFVNAEVQGSPGSRYSCRQTWPGASGDQPIAFTLYTFAFGYLIPCALIIFFYSMVLYRLKTVGPEKKSKEKKGSQRKTTRLVMAVVLVFILCWMPYWIYQLRLIPRWKLANHSHVDFAVVNQSFIPFNWTAFQGNEAALDSSGRTSSIVHFILAHVFQLFGYVNSAVNPILYSFMSMNFRKSFQRVFTCRFVHEMQPDQIQASLEQRKNKALTQTKNNNNNKKKAIFSNDVAMVTYESSRAILVARDDVEREPLVDHQQPHHQLNHLYFSNPRRNTLSVDNNPNRNLRVNLISIQETEIY